MHLISSLCFPFLLPCFEATICWQQEALPAHNWHWAVGTLIVQSQLPTNKNLNGSEDYHQQQTTTDCEPSRTVSDASFECKLNRQQSRNCVRLCIFFPLSFAFCSATATNIPLSAARWPAMLFVLRNAFAVVYQQPTSKPTHPHYFRIFYSRWNRNRHA